MKKISKIIMCTMSTVVIVFSLPLSAIAGYSSWTQTTQADFDAGTKTNIDTVSEPGSFRLSGGEQILNGSFENGSGSNPFNFDNWTEYTDVYGNFSANIYRNSSIKKSGNYSVELLAYRIDGYGQANCYVISDPFNYRGGDISAWYRIASDTRGGGIECPGIGSAVYILDNDENIISVIGLLMSETLDTWHQAIFDENLFVGYIGENLKIKITCRASVARIGIPGCSIEKCHVYYDLVQYTAYESSGDLISQNHHFGTELDCWGPIEITKTLNGQTTVTIKTQTAPDNGGVPGTWESERELDSNDKPQSTIYSDTWFRWRAYLSTTDGTKTPVVDDITINYGCKPTIPVLSSPPDSSTLDDSRPILTWINSIDRDGDTLTYKIIVDNNSNFYSPEAVGSNIIEDPSTTSYIPPPLVDDTYYWMVCANDGSANSDWSAPWSFTLDTKAPEVVSIYPPDDGQIVAEEVGRITVDFSEDIDETTVTSESIYLSDQYGNNILLQGEVIYCSSITLSVPQLEYCREYNIFISRNIKDTIGHSLVRDYNFSFITLIPEERTASVTVEHKTDGVIDRVWIDNPARTFPEGSKRCYINLEDVKDTEISSLSDYVKGTGRRLICYGVDYSSDNPKDIDQLNSPVTISIPYHPRYTKDKRNLKLYFYNNDVGRWESVEGSGDENPGDTDYHVTGEVRITNTEYCVIGFAMGGLIGEYSNYPNPFKAGKEKTTIEYDLDEDANVTISIYDLLGQLVRRIKISKGIFPGGKQGPNPVPWDGRNERGRVVANGGYYCVLEADTETGKHMKKVRKIMVIK